MKIKVIIALSITLFSVYISSGTELKFNKNYEFIKNDYKFIDSSFIYYSNIGCANLGVNTNNIYLQFKQTISDSIKYNNLSIEFLNVIDSNVQIFESDKYSKEVQFEDENGVPIYNNSCTALRNLSFRNIYKNLDLDIKFRENYFEFQIISFKNILNDLKMKFNGIDSIKYVSNVDSSLICFLSGMSFKIPKLKTFQIDSLNDTTYISSNFIINQDTISININYIDTNQVLLVQTEGYEVNSNYIFEKYEIISDEYELQDSIVRIVNNNKSNKIKLFTRIINSNDYLRELGTTQNVKFKTTPIKTLNYQFSENNKLVNEKIITRYNSLDSIEIVSIKLDELDNFVILCHTNFELKGNFKKSLRDTLSYNFINSDFKNNLIFKISKYGSIFNSYYLNFFDSTFVQNDLVISDFYVDVYDYVFVGSGRFFHFDSTYNFNNKLINIEKNSIQKGVVLGFNSYYDLVYNTIYIGNTGINEYLHLNNVIKKYDNNLDHKVLLVSGVTNSQTILDSTSWSKNENSNDNIIIKLDFTLDTIYNIKQIGGLGNECPSGDYLSFKNKLFNLSNQKTAFWGETSSSQFYDSINVLYNTRNYNNNCVFGVILDDSLKINTCLFIESNLDNKLIDIIKHNNYFITCIESKSNSFLMSDSLHLTSLDSISLNTSFYKSFSSIVDEKLFWTQNNTQTNKPFWSSYIEAVDSDIKVSNILFESNSLILGVNANSSNLILTSNYNLNNNFNNNFKDGCLIKIKL